MLQQNLFSESKQLPKVVVYTDGACQPNPGPGGWAAILRHNGKVKEMRGFEDATTNNRMEMRAVVAALEALKEPCEVELFTDSMILVYLLNGKGMKPSKRQNQDLVRHILDLMQIHTITAKWVKGHADDPFNNRCDELASLAIRENVFSSFV